MAREKREKRYSLASRLIAITSFMALMVLGLIWWIAGFSLYVGAATLVALGGLLGPAAVDSGGGILEFLSGLLELIGDVISTIFDCISSIFSGFG